MEGKDLLRPGGGGSDCYSLIAWQVLIVIIILVPSPSDAKEKEINMTRVKLVIFVDRA